MNARASSVVDIKAFALTRDVTAHERDALQFAVAVLDHHACALADELERQRRALVDLPAGSAERLAATRRVFEWALGVSAPETLAAILNAEPKGGSTMNTDPNRLPDECEIDPHAIPYGQSVMTKQGRVCSAKRSPDPRPYGGTAGKSGAEQTSAGGTR